GHARATSRARISTAPVGYGNEEGCQVIRKAAMAVLMITAAACPTAAQTIPPPEDSRHSMLRAAMLGLLPAQPIVLARQNCLTLPVDPVNVGLQGPQGGTQLSAECAVIAFMPAGSGPAAGWMVARYQWTLMFTAEDGPRGPVARDTAIEEEVVLLEPA